MTRRTAFDDYVGARSKKSSEFTEAHAKAKREIAAVDSIVRALDEARERAHLTKAELARRSGMPAETVRKLFTAHGVNPELATISRIAAQLGLKLTLKRAQRTSVGRSAECGSETRRRGDGPGRSPASKGRSGRASSFRL